MNRVAQMIASHGFDNLNELASRLKVTRQTIYNWIAEDQRSRPPVYLEFALVALEHGIDAASDAETILFHKEIGKPNNQHWKKTGRPPHIAKLAVARWKAGALIDITKERR